MCCDGDVLLSLLDCRPVANYVTSTVETVLALHREERNGDVLAFLTGQEEVETVVSQIRWVWSDSLTFPPQLSHVLHVYTCMYM